MTEGGVLSSVRRGTTYQVRYASPHPHDMERQPYPCPDEGTLVALLHHCGLEAWSLHRALAELQYAHMAVLLIVLAEAQRQMDFPRSQGTITTPFDMTVVNDMDRFYLVGDAIDRLPHVGSRAAYVKQAMGDKLMAHRHYITRHGEDMPEIRHWQWGQQTTAATHA